jgi:hypothetical protein
MGFIISTPISGTYAPIVTNETNNIIVSTTIATYIKVGNIVNCFIQLEITMDTFETQGTFEISLPIASNFTSQKNILGLLQWSNNGVQTNINNLTIYAETANNTCFVDMSVLSMGSNMQYCVLNIQYQVI